MLRQEKHSLAENATGSDLARPSAQRAFRDMHPLRCELFHSLGRGYRFVEYRPRHVSLSWVLERARDIAPVV